MSPTLYTARNNGEENNGGNTTMVTTTTVANNGIGHGDIQSVFLSFHYRVDRTGIQTELVFRRRQFTSDVVGHTRDCIDRMCPEL